MLVGIVFYDSLYLGYMLLSVDPPQSVMTMNLLGFQQVPEEELPRVKVRLIYRAAPKLVQQHRFSKGVRGDIETSSRDGSLHEL